MAEIDCDNCERIISEEEAHKIRVGFKTLILCSFCADVYQSELL